jgi:preprotein translocase subunit SecA
MMESIREESIGFIFNVEVEVNQEEAEAQDGEEHPHLLARGLDAPERPSELHYSAPTIDGDQAVIEFDEELDLDFDAEDDDEQGGDVPAQADKRRGFRRNKG